MSSSPAAPRRPSRSSLRDERIFRDSQPPSPPSNTRTNTVSFRPAEADWPPYRRDTDDNYNVESVHMKMMDLRRSSLLDAMIAYSWSDGMLDESAADMVHVSIVRDMPSHWDASEEDRGNVSCVLRKGGRGEISFTDNSSSECGAEGFCKIDVSELPVRRYQRWIKGLTLVGVLVAIVGAVFYWVWGSENMSLWGWTMESTNLYGRWLRSFTNDR